VETHARSLELVGNQARAKAIREIFARDGWQAYLRGVVKSSPSRISASNLAELGEYDKAIEAIVQQSESPSAFWLFLNRSDPFLDPIRGDPRFKEAMKKLDPPQ
jgi:hypothetical protein